MWDDSSNQGIAGRTIFATVVMCLLAATVHPGESQSVGLQIEVSPADLDSYRVEAGLLQPSGEARAEVPVVTTKLDSPVVMTYYDPRLGIELEVSVTVRRKLRSPKLPELPQTEPVANPGSVVEDRDGPTDT